MPRVILESDIRENELIGLIGTNGVGKSTKLKTMAEEWRRNNEGPIMSCDPHHILTAVTDFIINAANDDYKKEILNMRNGLILLDDFRILHPKNISEKWLMELLQFRRAYNVDIMYVQHSPSMVLNVLSYYTTKYYVFYTESTLGSWQKKIPNYRQCLAASMYINNYVSIKGKGKYPNFPYIIVDNITRKLTGININKQYV